MYTNPDLSSWVTDNKKGGGFTTIIEAYSDQPTFSSVHGEYLENIFELYS